MSWSFVNPLSRRPKAGYPDAVARLQTATRALFGLSDDVVVLVTEINCREAGCPDVETVVAVLRAGEKPYLDWLPRSERSASVGIPNSFLLQCSNACAISSML